MSRLIALTHTPSPNMQGCERTFVPHLPISYSIALKQFSAYCQSLSNCGCEVRTLDVNHQMPDCAFIEDTAIVLDELAVLASMGAESRRREPAGIEPALREFTGVERIAPPATIEGGDVLRVGRTLLVGQSRRTNPIGVSALSFIVEPLGYRVVPVPVRNCLHLKTACTALPDGRLLVNPAWVDESALDDFELVRVPASEPWGANVVLAGTTILLAASHARTASLVREFGFAVETVDVSEFAKAEAGVTCLSLLVPR